MLSLLFCQLGILIRENVLQLLWKAFIEINFFTEIIFKVYWGGGNPPAHIARLPQFLGEVYFLSGVIFPGEVIFFRRRGEM